MNNEFNNQSFFKSNPTDVLRDFSQQVFNQFSNKSFAVNVYDFDHYYLVEGELPGVTKEDITIKYDNQQLIISASKQVHHDDAHTVTVSERHTGQLERRFDFNDINKKEITATFENGVLSIKLPKQQVSSDDATTISIS